VVNESLVLTEGDPAVYIDIVKEFETDLPVIITFSAFGDFPIDADPFYIQTEPAGMI